MSFKFIMLALVAFLSCFIVTGCVATGGVTSLNLVKARTLKLLRYGSGSGQFRSDAIADMDRRVEDVSSKIEPIDWEDKDDPEFHKQLSGYFARLRYLAEGYATIGCKYYKDQAILDQLLVCLDSGLDCFNPETPRPGNWHSWLIMIPRHLGALSLLIEEQLDRSMKKRIVEALEDELGQMSLTGANAAWEAENHSYLALLTGDSQRLSRASKRMFSTVRYSSDTGVREDYGFLFHGYLPYAGSYGAGFASTISQFMYLFDSTEWACEAEQLDLMTNYLLEHVRWFVVGNSQDIHIRGRGFMDHGRPHPFIAAMLLMGQIDFDRADQLNSAAVAMIYAGGGVPGYLGSFADGLDTSDQSDCSGFKYWYTAEMGSYKGKNYHVGWRQFSRRVQDYEYLTRKGGTGWNLAAGFTYISKTGSEIYEKRDGVRGIDIYDWDRLPSATSRIGAHPINDSQDISDSGHGCNFGSAEFCGGAGFDDSGVSGFVLVPVNGDFAAHKSLHFFQGCFVAAGSSINSTKSDLSNPVQTTVLQWAICDGPIEVRLSDGSVLSEIHGDKLLKKINWLHLDSIGCVFYKPTDIFIKRTGHVITVWLDHGNNPKNAAYEYAVLPDCNVEQVKKFAVEKPIRPLAISPAVHCVADMKTAAKSIVFFNSGQACGFSSDSAAIISVNSSRVVSVQNPLADERQLSLTVPLTDDFTAADDCISLIGSDNNKTAVKIDTKLGRIYRFGLGEIAAEKIKPYPREDLSEYHLFTVQAENFPDHTILTMRLTDNALNDGSEITLRGHKGHELRLFTQEDVIEIVDANTYKFRWDRPAGDSQLNDTFSQSEGDFRIYLRGKRAMGMDYFSVPHYDSDGQPTDYDPKWKDKNNPHWYDK